MSSHVWSLSNSLLSSWAFDENKKASSDGNGFLFGRQFCPAFEPCSFNLALVNRPRSRPFSVWASRRFKPESPTTTPETINKVVRNLLAGGVSVTKVLDQHGASLYPVDWFAVLEGVGRRQKWVLALEIFRWIQVQRWYRPDNGYYTKLISIMGKEQQVRRAMWLFTEMMRIGCRPDTSVYNSVMSAHLHNRNKERGFKKALGAYEQMKTKQKCQPNLVSYNILTRAAAQLGKYDTLEVILNEMRERLVEPDIYTFNGLMDAYGKAGHCEVMEEILKRMDNEKIKPDVVTFNILIDSYGKAGLFEKMDRVLASMLRQKPVVRPTLKTFNSMITNYGNAGLHQKIGGVLEEMTLAGVRPSFITFDSLIGAFGLAGEFEKMNAVVEEMIQSGMGLQKSTLSRLVRIYCDHGLLDEAEAVLREASIRFMIEPTAVSYNIILRKYKAMGLVQRMQAVLEEMEKMGVKANKEILIDVIDTSSVVEQGANGADPGIRAVNENEDIAPVSSDWSSLEVAASAS